MYLFRQKGALFRYGRQDEDEEQQYAEKGEYGNVNCGHEVGGFYHARYSLAMLSNEKKCKKILFRFDKPAERW